MYRFIDVNEIQDEFFTSPDSFTVNGVLPESKILGYHTLNVSGREMLSSEIGEKDISHADGTIYLYKRDLPRELVVTYQLIAPNPEEFMRRFNALCAMLNGEQMQIIFNDEQDKYFTATKSSVELPEPGRLAVTGTYTLYCTDPYKYALKEKTIESYTPVQLTNNGNKDAIVSLVFAVGRSEGQNYDISIDNTVFYKIRHYQYIPEDTEIVIDFKNVDFKIGNVKSWVSVTLDSQALVLKPGKHKLEINGSVGNIKATYRERWL